MKKRLLSVTDENAILITAEFRNSVEKNKVGEEKNQRYEIDLIVKNDITVDQLLIAVGLGLKSTLAQKGFDLENDPTVFYNKDSFHPEAETHDYSDTALAQAALGIPKDKKWLNPLDWFNRSKALMHNRRFRKKAGALTEKEAEITEEREQQDSATNVGYSDDCVGLITCWNIFNICYQSYSNPKYFVEKSKTKSGFIRKRNKTSTLIPVIGKGSVDYNKIEPGELLCESDRPQILLKKKDGGKRLTDVGFITTTRLVFDPIGKHQSAALLDPTHVIEAFRKDAPHYNISERPLRTIDDTPVHIIPPTDPPQKSRQSILTTVLTPLLMAGAMIGIRILTESSTNMASMGLLTGCMSVISAIVAIINYLMRNKEHKKSVVEWKDHYERYIRHLVDEIKIKQSDDVAILRQLYPPTLAQESSDLDTSDLISLALSVNGDIFSRGQDHPDYLNIRIGVSTENSALVPSVFPIIGEKKETIYAAIKYQNLKNNPGYEFSISLPSDNDTSGFNNGGYLIDLPSDIAKEYAFLEKAPVMLSIRKCRSLGVVFEKPFDFQPFLSNCIFELCYYHSPDDLQLIMLCDENSDWQSKQAIIRNYKHLPHFRELLGDLSAFAFQKADAIQIFNKLLEILSARKQGEKTEKYPHIVVIVLQEYGIKNHPISEYLPSYGEDDASNYGISFVFCKRYQEELPKYCEFIIKREKFDETEDCWYLLPHSQVMSRSSEDEIIVSDLSQYIFIPDAFIQTEKTPSPQRMLDKYYRAFKVLSALHYERIAQSSNVPGSVELLDILGNSKADEKEQIQADIKKYINENWGLSRIGNEQSSDKMGNSIYDSIAVDIGKSANGVVALDLHEKADGPHMLVAGTTGSGKTETVLSYLVSLCAKYSPEQVNLLLMDMKGAGFVQRIGDEKKGTCLPHVVGTVTDISGDETGTGTAYMLKRFLHSMNSEVKRRKLLLSRMGVDSVDGYAEARNDIGKHLSTHPKLNKQDIENLPPLPHLFLVIDEFTELMRFSSDNDDVNFKDAITSLARIGRSLGFHIILISQNIENAITPDIRVNSKARLCLKVATKDASKEMIGTDLAASPLMPGNGRAYLLIGTGSRFEYFQSAYSGADITRNLDAPILITNASMSGQFTLFYDSESMGRSFESFLEKDIFSSYSVEESENGLATSDSAIEEGKASAIETGASAVEDELSAVEDEASVVEDGASEDRHLEGEQETETTEDTNDTTEEDASTTNDDAEIRTAIRSKKGETQLEVVVGVIRQCFLESQIEKPHQVFQQPLPNACYYDYDFATGDGETKLLKKPAN